MVSIILKAVFVLSFFCFFYFLYYVLIALQKGEEDFSTFYKLMVVSSAVCVGILLYHFY